jgi:hypothetical protein
VELTVYKADFEITCWHEFCSGRCNWLSEGRCLLFEQALKKKPSVAYMHSDMPNIFRCQSCVKLCANLAREDEEVG